MMERYERLFSLPGLLYIQGSPVIIEAGALLKDNQYNNIVAQLKFKNISEKVIKAVSVKIFAMDTAQRPLGEPLIFQYLDLSAYRDDNFGQNVPVILSNSGTRSIFISVTEVIFSDNEVWSSDEGMWQSLPVAVSLEDFFKDPEMTKQFRIHYGSDCSVCPVQIGDLWYCTCGSINHTNELLCHHCGKDANNLFSVNLGIIAKEKEDRLQREAWEKQLAEQKAAAERAQKEAEEKAKKQKIAQEKAAAEKKAKAKRKKTVIIMVSILSVMLALFLARMIVLSQKYRNAEILFDEKKYEESASIFNELGSYKESKTKLSNVYYQHGQELLRENKFEEARTIFNKSEDYDEAKKWLDQAYYEEGKYYLSLQNYDNAIDALKKANAYEDAQVLLRQAYYEKGKLLLDAKDYDSAIPVLQLASGYSDGALLLQQAYYEKGKLSLSSQNYSVARQYFEKAGEYKDAADLFQQAYYDEGVSLILSKDYTGARQILSNIKKYKDVSTQINRTYYEEGLDLFEKKQYGEAAKAFKNGANYSDSQSYYYYCLIKPINFNDGSWHSLSDYYIAYDQIKTEKLRAEFRSLPQIQRIEALEGTWSVSSSKYSDDRAECKSGICTYYTGKYKGNDFEIYYLSGEYIMHNLRYSSLYKIITEFSNNAFRTDTYHLYTGRDTTYSNEVVNHYR